LGEVWEGKGGEVKEGEEERMEALVMLGVGDMVGDVGVIDGWGFDATEEWGLLLGEEWGRR